ncbi:MAG: NUDIX hydrolase [Nanoarchaeota archaeon]
MIFRAIIHLLGIQTAVAAIIVKDGKVLLTKRSRLLAEGGKWCLPGGGMKKYEKSIDATKREVMEEVGLNAKDCKLLFVHEEVVKRLGLHANVYVYSVKVSGNIKTNWEVIKAEWFTRNEVEKMNLAFTHKDILRRYWSGK